MIGNVDAPWYILVQRVYEDDVVTVGPFSGRKFTGWHRVTRFDGTKPHRFWLPPCHELMGWDRIQDGFSGFEISNMRMLNTDDTRTTETETERIESGVVLYGQPLHIGIAGIRRAMRKADLLESSEGYGG